MGRRDSAIILAALTLVLSGGVGQAQRATIGPPEAFPLRPGLRDTPVNTIKEAFARLQTCWRPPPPSQANPIDITVIVSFNRAGEILGRPKITYESEQATDNDRLLYRIAVMEALQRCTPMPFTESMGGAVAGRPFAVRFHSRKSSSKPERKAWLTQKIL